MHHDPSITRSFGWQQRLDALFAERMRAPFAWGTQDCALFAADAVQAQTGADPAEAFRGRYGNESEAQQVLDSLGGLEACGARAGSPIPPLTASAGDIGLVSDGERELLAVCAGSHWLAPGRRGLAALPLQAARIAWRVPRG